MQCFFSLYLHQVRKTKIKRKIIVQLNRLCWTVFFENISRNIHFVTLTQFMLLSSLWEVQQHSEAHHSTILRQCATDSGGFSFSACSFCTQAKKIHLKSKLFQLNCNFISTRNDSTVRGKRSCPRDGHLQQLNILILLF